MPNQKNNYYFPSLLRSTKTEQTHPFNKDSYVTIDSGTSALRLLIKSLLLPEKTKVAIPAFICKSAKTALEKAGVQPYLLDLKDNNSFLTEYNFKNILQSNVKAIILVHLYGYLHPDTERITEFCLKNNIHLIHDNAQSLGINESELLRSNGIIYSFGPGKSSNAAGGAFIRNGGKEFYTLYDQLNHSGPLTNFLINTKAKNQVKANIYNYPFGIIEKIKFKLTNQIIKLGLRKKMFKMNEYQLAKANEVANLVIQNKENRKNNHKIIADSLQNHKVLSLCYDTIEGVFFKAVIFNNSDNRLFEKYLQINGVPHYRIFEEDSVYFKENMAESILPVFKKNACHIFEFSSEATIPLEEIHRISLILKNYKG